jgi:hypothetical protein
MDEHLSRVGVVRGRVAESVWYVAYLGTMVQLRDYVSSILSPGDLLLVVEATDAAWCNLLVDSQSLISAWNNNR